MSRRTDVWRCLDSEQGQANHVYKTRSKIASVCLRGAALASGEKKSPLQGQGALGALSMHKVF